MTHLRPHLAAIALTFAAVPLAHAATATILLSPDAGATPTIRAFNPAATQLSSYNAYSPSFTGGVRIALADFTSDGAPDHLTAPGPGALSQVQVFNGSTLSPLASFLAFPPTYYGGVSVAAADVTHDGHPDILAATSSQTGQVRVFDSLSGTIVRDFLPYGPSFTAGLSIASGDVNGDGYSDIITAPAGSGSAPEVRVFSGADGSLLRSFYAYSPSFLGGLTIASADVDGDGLADIITGAGPGGTPQVNIFRGADASLLRSLYAYAPTFTGGVRVAAADLNSDGHADLLTSPGPGAPPQVNTYSGLDGSLLSSFLAYDPSFTYGLYIAASPIPEPTTLAAFVLLLPAQHRPTRRHKPHNPQN